LFREMTVLGIAVSPYGFPAAAMSGDLAGRLRFP
jgi:hypothetical protein